MSKGLQVALGATLVAGLLGWYAVTNLGGEGTFRYYESLEDFRAVGMDTRSSRVHGYVVLGSIERDMPARVVRFRVQNDPPHAGAGEGDALSVVYESLEIPDLFKDGAEVVVEGRLAPGGEFHASNVLAKCPSKFAPEEARASL